MSTEFPFETVEAFLEAADRARFMSFMGLPASVVSRATTKNEMPARWLPAVAMFCATHQVAFPTGRFAAHQIPDASTRQFESCAQGDAA